MRCEARLAQRRECARLYGGNAEGLRVLVMGPSSCLAGSRNSDVGRDELSPCVIFLADLS